MEDYSASQGMSLTFCSKWKSRFRVSERSRIQVKIEASGSFLFLVSHEMKQAEVRA
jgi:hypothetical protein